KGRGGRQGERTNAHFTCARSPPARWRLSSLSRFDHAFCAGDDLPAYCLYEYWRSAHRCRFLRCRAGTGWGDDGYVARSLVPGDAGAFGEATAVCDIIGAAWDIVTGYPRYLGRPYDDLREQAINPCANSDGPCYAGSFSSYAHTESEH